MARSIVRMSLVMPPILLVGGSLLSDAAAATAAMVLTAVYVGSLLAGWWPGFLAAAVAAGLALPVLFAPFLGTWSILLLIPVVPAMVRGMVALAPSFLPTEQASGRAPSPLASSLWLALAATALLALILSLASMMWAAFVLLLFISGAFVTQYLRLGRTPVETEPARITARAGDQIDIPVQLRRTTPRSAVHAVLSGVNCAVAPAEYYALRDGARAVVSVTPRLGGPAEIALRASITDTFGLVQAGQGLHVADLNVIPRAQIAQRTAEALLQGMAGGAELGRMLSGEVAGFLAFKSGVEYQSSRMYVPGDSLRSIDWKHTARLRSMVVKTYDDGAESAGLLLANLSAANAEEADRLVYELLSAALTIAATAHVAALGVYNHREESSAWEVMEGLRLISKALGACADVRIAPVWRRISAALSMQEAEARLMRLRRSSSEGAAPLAGLLGLGSASLRRRVDGSAATTLLQAALHSVQPAWCIAVSAMHGDAEAVLTGLRVLEGRGIRTLLIDVRDGARGVG